MADDRGSDPDSALGARQILSAGALLLAVLLVLGLGALLRVDPSKPRPSVATSERSSRLIVVPSEEPTGTLDSSEWRARETKEALRADPTPSPSSEPPPRPKEIAVEPRESASTSLPSRAETDRKRLRGMSGEWTLQLLYACRAETVERFLTRSPGSTSLFVIPALEGGGCFRVCWGSYASIGEAQQAAARIPDGVVAEIVPRAVKVATLVR